MTLLASLLLTLFIALAAHAVYYGGQTAATPFTHVHQLASLVQLLQIIQGLASRQLPPWLRDVLNVVQFPFGGNSTGVAWRCVVTSDLGSFPQGLFSLLMQLLSLFVIVLLSAVWLVLMRVLGIRGRQTRYIRNLTSPVPTSTAVAECAEYSSNSSYRASPGLSEDSYDTPRRLQPVGGLVYDGNSGVKEASRQPHGHVVLSVHTRGGSLPDEGSSTRSSSTRSGRASEGDSLSSVDGQSYISKAPNAGVWDHRITSTSPPSTSAASRKTRIVRLRSLPHVVARLGMHVHPSGVVSSALDAGLAPGSFPEGLQVPILG